MASKTSGSDPPEVKKVPCSEWTEAALIEEDEDDVIPKTKVQGIGLLANCKVKSHKVPMFGASIVIIPERSQMAVCHPRRSNAKYCNVWVAYPYYLSFGNLSCLIVRRVCRNYFYSRSSKEHQLKMFISSEKHMNIFTVQQQCSLFKPVKTVTKNPILWAKTSMKTTKVQKKTMENR